MRRILVIVVAVLVAAEAFVAYKVIRDRPEADAEPAATGSPTKTTPAATATPEGPEGAVSLSFSEDGRLFRSWLGSCSEPGRARLEISGNGGQTFDEIALPVLDEKTAVRTVLAVDASDDQEVTIIASDDRCRTGAYRTDDGGQAWDTADVSGWYVSADGSEVGIGDTSSEPGCVVQTVVPLPTNRQNAKVLCDGGTIIGTNDSGGEWTTLGELPGAVDFTFTSLRDGMAVRETDDCAAEVMDTADAGGGWESLACVVEKSDFAPSAIASRGDVVYVQVGGDLYRSEDGGHEWRNAEERVE